MFSAKPPRDRSIAEKTEPPKRIVITNTMLLSVGVFIIMLGIASVLFAYARVLFHV